LILRPWTWTWTGARATAKSAFDSSTGWLLPNTAGRSPDAARIFKQRINGIQLRLAARQDPRAAGQDGGVLANGAQLAC
jgi:Uma2 family endonuclease